MGGGARKSEQEREDAVNREENEATSNETSTGQRDEENSTEERGGGETMRKRGGDETSKLEAIEATPSAGSSEKKLDGILQKIVQVRGCCR